jgi:preprotein translocase subunit SecE
MNAKVEQTGNTPANMAKLIASVLIVAAAVFAFYWFSDLSGAVRAAGLILSLGAAVALFLTTTQGHAAREYVSESNFELRKVVWPTRQETIQTTIVIAIVVVILSLILWVIDLALGWVILDKLLKP